MDDNLKKEIKHFIIKCAGIVIMAVLIASIFCMFVPKHILFEIFVIIGARYLLGYIYVLRSSLTQYIGIQGENHIWKMKILQKVQQLQ